MSRFSGEPVPPLKALDTEGRVIFLGTCSKIFCPGIRIGWVVADAELLGKFVLAKQGVDLHTSTLSQRLLAVYLRDDDPAARIVRICDTYRERRDRMVAALADEIRSLAGTLGIPTVATTEVLYHSSARQPLHDVLTCIREKTTLAQAGTLGTARPDIANQVRFRKEEELRQGIHALNGRERVLGGEVKLLTACPACQQGLNRYRDSTGLEVRYMVEELARVRLGADWQQAFTDQVLRGGIERVLL